MTIANNAPENNQYPIGNTKVTWTAKDNAGNNATCDQMITVKVCKPVLELSKTALERTVKPGEDINYTIRLCNNGLAPLTNVTLWDVLPGSVELVYVYPEPKSNYIWYIGTLSPGQCFVVDLRVHVPIVDTRYDMSQGVWGEGFVNVHNDYDTSLGPKSVENCAYAQADFISTISSCADTGIVNPGTELKRREFGSGSYESEEPTKIRTENKSIRSISNLSAVHQPTSD